MSRQPSADLLAAVERDLADHGRAKVIGNRSSLRRMRQLGHALDERIADRDDISWARGAFPDGRCWLHACMNDIGHPYSALYFHTDADKPDWWRQ